MDAGGTFIYCHDDPYSAAYTKKKKIVPQVCPVSTTVSFSSGAYSADNFLHFTSIAKDFKISLDNIPLSGVHNQYNTMMATTVAGLIGIGQQDIQKSLFTFQGLSHRMEWVVAAPKDVHCYNDAKATNVEAAYASLMSFDSPIIWIVGGEDKGNNYASLLPVVQRNVKAIICLGKENSKLIKTFQHLDIPISETELMEEAVQQGLKVAASGDTLLLAPACASFDLFKNFMEKGDSFKRVIEEMMLKL